MIVDHENWFLSISNLGSCNLMRQFPVKIFQNSLKSMVPAIKGSATYATSPSTNLINSPYLKARLKKGEIVPVSISLGMIMLSTCFGIHTAKQQLKHCPNVSVKKSRRETIPEEVEPEHVVEESEKFIKNSFFRKLAHIQDQYVKMNPNPGGGDILARKYQVESLKDVGLDPKLS